MKRVGFAVGICAVWLLCSASAADPRVVLETELGDIELEVMLSRAPRTGANFLRYVDAGLYDNGVFHRAVKPDNQPVSPIKIEVIQASADPGREKEYFSPIALERTNETGLRHKNGILSMARTGPDTATEGIFITIGDQPSLDFGGKRNPDGQGFAAFGRVIRGMDVVKRIQQSPVKEQRLTPVILIRRAYRK